uniref:GDP-D-glucose phosphorylase 1 n=1 Tax=Syphacia muris TaxID=451379 RepID=A0A0N5AJ90_9BILA
MLPVGLQAKTPVFTYETSDFIYDLRGYSPDDVNVGKCHQMGKLKDLIMARWEAARAQNAIKYNLNCMYKLLPGDFNLSMQLNVERGELRRKPQRFHRVRESFHDKRWNFTKLEEKEILLYLRCRDRPCSSDPLDQHVLAVNNSPLERGHSLIIPSLISCQPQVMTEASVRLATDVMLLIDDDTFHVLFNSLLAQASVNHLHLHALFWPYDSDLINRKCEELSDGMFVIRRPNWFVHTIVFQLTSAEMFDTFVRKVTKTLDYLSEAQIAHNVIFSRAQPLRTTGDVWCEDSEHSLPQLVTAYIIPRNSVVGAKPATNFNPAALELCGCLTAYTFRFFESATEESALRIIDEEATLPDVQFEGICAKVIDVLQGRGFRRMSIQQDTDEDVSFEPSLMDELRDSFQTFALHSPRRLFKNESRGTSSSKSPVSAFQFSFEKPQRTPIPPSPMATTTTFTTVDSSKTESTCSQISES